MRVRHISLGVSWYWSVIITVILVGVSLFAAVQPVTADPVSPDGKLDMSGIGPIKFSPPTLVDLDNNGDVEILVGTNDGKVVAINRSSVPPYLTQMWSFDTSGPLGGSTSIRAAISAADLDGDGSIEIVAAVGDVFEAGTVGGLVVLNTNGQLLWQYKTHDHMGVQGKPDGRSDGIVGTPALGDLDNDGKMEIIFGGFDFRVHVLHHDGKLAQGWPIFIRDTVWSSPALADINNDGFLNIVIGVDVHQEPAPFNTVNGGAIYVFRSDGTIVEGWPQFISQVIFSSPAVGDLDGDGILEIVHGTGDFFPNTDAGYKLYAWNATGSLKWTGVTSGYVYGSPAIGDIDSDGKLEVIVNSRDDRKTFAWNHDGSQLWAVTPTNFQGNTITLIGAPVLADYSGDGKPDVFTNVFWDSAILDGPTGQQFTANSFPGNPRPGYVSGFSTADNAPAVGDIDGDGFLELVLASANNAGTQAQVVYWDLPTTANVASAPWPMFGQNAAHTSVHPTAVALASQVIVHTLPEAMLPGEVREVSITVKNTGRDTWAASTRANAAGPIILAPVNQPEPLSGPVRTPVSNQVAAGQDTTFKITLTAPTKEGYYTTYWRLKDESNGKFFGRAVKVEMKVGNQPALHVLTTQGFKSGGLAPQALPGTTPPFTNWPASLVFKLTHNKRGYYFLDSFGGFWYGGQNFPLLSAGSTTGLADMLLGPDGISYYLLKTNGSIIGCNTDICTLGFTPAPPTNIQARSFALAVTTDPQEAKNALGVYVLDGFGNVYTGGAAPAISKPSGLPVAQDIFVRIKLKADGKGYYLLDKYGRIWNGGSAPALAPNYTPKTGEDWARDFELTADEKGFYMLDKDGKVYSGGDAPDLTVNIPASGPGIGRDLELVDTRKSSAPSASFTPDGIGIFHENGATGPIQTTISLSNQGATAFQWTASAAWPTPVRMPVVKITPNSGTLNPGAAQPLAVEISGLDGLSNGVYTVDIAVSATGVTGGPQINRTTKLTVLVVDQVHSVNLPQITR